MTATVDAATGAVQRVAIVGGGLAGSLLALALSERGYRVDVFERRSDPRVTGAESGRSINLGLSKRGIQALTEVGLIDMAMPLTVVMRGRVIHAPDGDTRFQPYGKNRGEVLYSIDRSELIRLLLDRAERQPGVTLHFDHRFVSADKAARELEIESEGEVRRVAADWVICADGAFSRCRPEMQRGLRADFHREYLEWGYKELTLAAGPNGESVIDLTALHVWPRAHCLFVSHPNRDGSHTLTLFLPHEGPDSFATTQTPDEIRALFQKYFPDLLPMLPALVEQWTTRPTGALVTTRTAPWRFDDWMVLVGDSAHAVYPFYGQGMNSAFEDCSALLAALKAHPADRAAAFAAYEQARRPHTDVLMELSKANFIELRQKVSSPWFLARKRLDVLLNRIFPGAWLPIYTMVSHTTMPYADALARARRQDRILGAVATGMVLAIGGGLWWGLRS
ncbi:MAG TPA: NAD(P)/FAD-dependent oxidoreductase [Xanthomonadaceae bacterium]